MSKGRWSLLVVAFWSGYCGEMPVRAEDGFTERSVVAQAAAQNPGLRATLLDERRAQALVKGERARYGYSLLVDGDATRSKRPELTVAEPVLLDQKDLRGGLELRRTTSLGTSLSLRFDMLRMERSLPVMTMPAPGVFQVDVVDLGPAYRYDATFSFSQPLLRGAGRRVGELDLRLAIADAERARAAHDRAASALLADVVLAYWELWYAARATRIQKAQLELAMQQEAEARTRADAGAIASIDVLEFSNRVASLREAVVEAELSSRRARIELAQLIGHSLQGELPLPSDDEPPGLPGPAADDLARAVEASPEIREALAQVELLRRREETAGEALRPRLDAGGKVALHGLGAADDAADGLDQLAGLRAYTAMLTLTFELPFDSTQKRMERKRANLEVEAGVLRLEELERKVHAELLALAREDQALVEQLELASARTALAEELARAAAERYAAGARTALDVVSANRSAEQAALRVARLSVDLHRARVRRLHLTGRLTARYAAK